MKIYISGKVSGLDATSVCRKFVMAQHRLEEFGHTVVNPVLVLGALPKDTKYGEYMELCMVMLKQCDAIYLLEDWEWSSGATAEQTYALALGKKILYAEYYPEGDTEDV